MHLHTRDSRPRKLLRRAARTLAPITWQTQNRMPNAQQPARMRTLDG
jgi:hypothetical protein